MEFTYLKTEALLQEDTFIVQSVILGEAALQILIRKREIPSHLKQN